MECTRSIEGDECGGSTKELVMTIEVTSIIIDDSDKENSSVEGSVVHPELEKGFLHASLTRKKMRGKCNWWR